MQQLGIIGANDHGCSQDLYDFAYHLGRFLGSKRIAILNGGMYGTMEAVAKGVYDCENKTSIVVGITPYDNLNSANKFLDIVIPTGIGMARNSILVLSSDIIIALGGGAGTLNELSYAWQYGKKVLCYTGGNGWSKELAGRELDSRQTKLFQGFNSIEELSSMIDYD